jgi:hypothetical protein
MPDGIVGSAFDGTQIGNDNPVLFQVNYVHDLDFKEHVFPRREIASKH